MDGFFNAKPDSGFFALKKFDLLLKLVQEQLLKFNTKNQVQAGPMFENFAQNLASLILPTFLAEINFLLQQL